MAALCCPIRRESSRQGTLCRLEVFLGETDMETAIRQIWEQLSETDFVTSRQIAAAVHISERTVRSRLKILEGELKRHGARLVAKQGYGYCLEIANPEEYEAFCRQQNQEGELIPSSSEERQQFLLAYLLNHSEYVKMDDLSRLLYISRNTLTADLRRVEYILRSYHLELERRPNYGICVLGEEFDKRRCIANCLLAGDWNLKGDKRERESRLLSDILFEIGREARLKLSESSFERLIVHIYVANGRITRGQGMELEEKAKKEVEKSIQSGSRELAKRIAGEIEKKLQIHYNESEILYLALHLSGKISSDSPGQYGSSLVISSQIDELVLKMLTAVYRENKIDLRNNLELRMSLNQHLIPLDVRLKYDIPLKNPLLEGVKREYAFAYTIAASACTALTEHYGREVPEDEVGYIAILFALALEKQGKKIEKKNIVVICVSGRGSSQLFIYKYKQAFGQYINKIYESTIYEVENLDFAGLQIDYVFTTVPLAVKLPVPVFEISLFLTDREVSRYRKLFESGDNGDFLDQYYDRNLFIGCLHAESKEQVLREMCDHAAKYHELPEGFYESVLQRERLGQTDFGNLIAIPHACSVMTQEKFVMAAVLDRPIWWGHNDVQLVLLIALSQEPDADIEKFYQIMTDLISDETAVVQMLQNPTFENLMRLLRKE